MTQPPGPELDAAVAAAIGWKLIDRILMGWGVGPPMWATGSDETPTYQSFRPSADPAAAAELKRALWATGRFQSIFTRWLVCEGCRYVEIEIWKASRSIIRRVGITDDPIRAECHALCLAAVEAMG